MLWVLTKTFRLKAAIVLAALYALCILAPSIAFALSSNPSIAHCLIENHVAVAVHDHGGKIHAHADGTAHRHHADGTAHRHHDDGPSPKHSGDGGQAANCCGLFSVVAVAGEPAPVLSHASAASLLAPVAPEALSGRGPERINRPPIV
jgi:hypothetical protein